MREKGSIFIMNKPELITAIKEATGGTKKDAELYFNATEKVIVEAIKRGEDVKIKGFVDFTSKEVAEGKARNPQNGEPVIVPAHRKATASLSKSLRKQ